MRLNALVYPGNEDMIKEIPEGMFKIIYITSLQEVDCHAR